MLLAPDDANPDQPDNNGRTPLYAAFYNGHDGVAKILLRRNNINPDRPDIHGMTPLMWAARRGLVGAIAFLQPLSSHLPSPTLQPEETSPSLPPSDTDN
jgi:ankyrin repeat protein